MSETTVLPPFAVTRTAIEAIEALGGAVRIDLRAGGCCGTTYAFSQVDAGSDVDAGSEVDPGDTRYGCPGAWLVVSGVAGPVLEGATLDYGARLRPPRFRILGNPNLDQVCPCRRSFGEPWPGPRQPTCAAYQPMPWDREYQPPMDWQRRTGWSR